MENLMKRFREKRNFMMIIMGHNFSMKVKN